MTGELNVMDHSGDTKLIWDSERKVEVDAVRDMFDKLKAKGYFAYRVEGKEGGKGEILHKFNPDVEKIIMAPMMAGGCC